MKLLRSLHDLPSELRGGAVTIGNFDGVHRGHARIVSNLLEQADRLQGPAIVFTFEGRSSYVVRVAVQTRDGNDVVTRALLAYLKSQSLIEQID